MPQSRQFQDLLKIVNVFGRKAITQLEKHLSKKENNTENWKKYLHKKRKNKRHKT